MDRDTGPASPKSKLAEILISDSRRIVSGLSRQSVASISPLECFLLLSSLGELKHDQWDALTKSESRKLDISLRDLEDQFSKLLMGKDDIQTCLELGITRHLVEMKGELEKVQSNLESARIGTGTTSYEINDGLLGMRDELGYAELLLQDYQLKLAPHLHEESIFLDDKIKLLLPRVLSLFRASNDDPTPNPLHFPEAFWWRRI